MQAKRPGDSILRVEGVTVSFSGFRAIDNLDFTLQRGELRVVIGPNGAGKTTLLDVVTGKVRPAAGTVWFGPHGKPARDITGLQEQEIARLGIGRKFQSPNVFKNLTVLENLHLSVRAPRGVLATLLAFTADGQGRVEEVLDLVGLTAKAHRQAGILSHGEKQWLELGMLLAQDPELLLVDEPVAGMTPRESERTGELLMAMARKHTLLVIDHDMSFVRQIARKVTVLDEGRLLCEGTVEEVQRNEKVIEVYLGQDKKAHAPLPRPAAPAARSQALAEPA
jgi:urea transport system ATP-binding protein